VDGSPCRLTAERIGIDDERNRSNVSHAYTSRTLQGM
jgi:hypothetical protein